MFKIGDEVVVIDDRHSKRWGKSLISHYYVNNIKPIGIIIKDEMCWFREDQIALANTVEGLVPGDSVWIKVDKEVKVLARQDNLLSFSYHDKHDGYGDSFTLTELKENNWTVKPVGVKEEKVEVVYGDNYTNWEYIKITPATKLEIERLLGIKK